MSVDVFIQGPLLWISFLIFFVGIALRLGFFTYSIVKSSENKTHKWKYDVISFALSLAPFHKAARKRPVYAALRYAFHICMIAVPVWLFGHVFLWSESSVGWQWISLPAAWADGMTLTLLFLATWFFLRRFAFKEVRANSSKTDLAFIALTALPFLTGYFLSHDTLDWIPAVGDNMLIIHILSGEAMLIMAAFQFVRTRLNESKCVGCAACELACPTGTLETADHENLRVFSYSHYQCVCCGSCVNACPESAAELRHEVSLSRFFEVFSKENIRSVELKTCEQCGVCFAPEPQIAKVARVVEADYLAVCPKCRKRNHAQILASFSPWRAKSFKPRVGA